jgi:hypothetical protein
MTREPDAPSSRAKSQVTLGTPVMERYWQMWCRGAGPRERRDAWCQRESAEARRSCSSSACPDSTLVRISRATASRSATCGLVSE